MQHYLLETGGCITINSQHDRRGANKASRYEHRVVVDLRNSADAESKDPDTCNQSKRYERLMDDIRRVLSPELTNVHDPPETYLTYQTAVSETLDEEGERETAPAANKIPR
jgi:hypothetical protein